MRRILIEAARRRLAAKRGAGSEVVDLDEIEIPSPVAGDDQLLAVNEGMEPGPPSGRRMAEACGFGTSSPAQRKWSS